MFLLSFILEDSLYSLNSKLFLSSSSISSLVKAWTFCFFKRFSLFSINSKYFLSSFRWRIKAVVLKSALTRAFLYKGEFKNSFSTKDLSNSFVLKLSTPATKSEIGRIGDWRSGTVRIESTFAMFSTFSKSLEIFFIVFKVSSSKRFFLD